MATLAILSVVGLMLVWLSAVFAHFHHWVPYQEPGKVRKSVFGLALLLLLLTAGTVTYSTFDRSSLDPGLAALTQESLEPERETNDELAKKFEADERSTYFGQALDQGPEDYFKAWLEAGEVLWTTEKWWEDEKFAPLVGLFSPHVGTYANWLEPIPSYSEIEARIRAGMGDESGSIITLERLSEAEFDSNQWDEIKRLSQQALEIHQAGIVDTVEQRSELYFSFSVLSMREYSSLDRVVQTVLLNGDWRHYQSIKTQLLREAPLSPTEVVSLAQNRTILSGPPTNKLQQDRVACLKALTLLVADIRHRQSLKQPVPSSVEEFEYLMPYRPWIQLKKQGDSVEVLLHTPIEIELYFTEISLKLEP